MASLTRNARRKQYMRRRAVVLAIVVALLGGLYYGINGLLTRLFGSRPETATREKQASAVTPAAKPLPFRPDYLMPIADLDGDGQPEQVAVGPAEGTLRQIGLVTGAEKALKLVGEAFPVPDFPLAVRDLPRARSLLVLAGSHPADREPRVVKVTGGQALEVAGGEPDFRAWQPDPVKGLAPVSYYELIAPLTPPEPTMILVDKWLNILWYFEDGKLVQTARISTGRHVQGPAPSAANAVGNFLTPTGRHIIANKIPGLPYYQGNIPRGDPRNPLGTRWLGFSVYSGDKGMLWAIHGTDQPGQIGYWNTRGAIRLTNPEIEALYDRVKEGTVLEIMSSQPAQ